MTTIASLEIGPFQTVHQIDFLTKKEREFTFDIMEIRFAKGNIKETYGEVLATLKRELDEDA